MPDERQDAIEAVAAEWVSRLSGEPLRPDERRALDGWLAEHPDHRATFDYARATWAELGVLRAAPGSLACDFVPPRAQGRAAAPPAHGPAKRGRRPPDIHPNVADIYRRKVERLWDALRRPQERDQAAAAIRDLIERITLTPGPKRGQVDAILHGEVGAILEWMGSQALNNKTDTPSAGVSVSVVAGACNQLKKTQHVEELAQWATRRGELRWAVQP